MNSLASFGSLSFIAAFALASCAKIYNGEELNPKVIQQLKHLGLLNSHERIYQFYSNASFRRGSAGNFYSTERIASYWLNDKKEGIQVNSAYYNTIARIDTVYLDKALTYVSYLIITKKDSSRFQVYVGGKRPAVKTFFENAIAQWKTATCICK